MAMSVYTQHHAHALVSLMVCGSMLNLESRLSNSRLFNAELIIACENYNYLLIPLSIIWDEVALLRLAVTSTVI